jgi:lipoprotein-anchoring transpeptidase ErfK/SrfK
MEKTMRRTRRESKAMTVAALLLMAFARAAAEENPEKQAHGKRIVVSIPDCKLALVEDGRVTKVYQTAVGAPVSPSPTGTFQIATRLSNPTYYHSGKVVGPGKNNPLGPRWLGLSLKGFGIHGTNAPRSIGHAASHGCIRLRNQDILDLFERVEVGDVVELHGERDESVARLFAPVPETGAAGTGGTH